jgi:hypothetical protein
MGRADLIGGVSESSCLSARSERKEKKKETQHTIQTAIH